MATQVRKQNFSLCLRKLSNIFQEMIFQGTYSATRVEHGIKKINTIKEMIIQGEIIKS